MQSDFSEYGGNSRVEKKGGWTEKSAQLKDVVGFRRNAVE